MPVIFPGAVGFGTQTRAAYGGAVSPTVFRVRNLNDSGAESLRDALEASVPRIVIFETSGTIPLNSDIYITTPYITVAGQTAPSPGITLKNYGIWIYSHDVLLQHFRIRPGDAVGAGDGLGQGIRAGVYEGDAYNLVFDHMSVSWTNDEGTIVAKTNAGDAGTSDANVTFWRCIVAEALNQSARTAPGETATEGKGFAVNYYSRKVSAIQNLYAHVANRIPLNKGGTSTAFINNLAYDWSYEPPALYGDGTEGGAQASFLASHRGNHFRTGPNWDPGGHMAAVRGVTTASRLYLADNILDAVGGTLHEFYVINNEGNDPRVSGDPLTVPGYTPVAGSAVIALVLANAGARPIDRDSVDTRIVQEVLSRSGHNLTSQSDVGGWPTLAVNSRVLILPSSPHAVTSSGYTNLERWLHGYSAVVESTSPPPPVPGSPPHAPTSVHVAAALVGG